MKEKISYYIEYIDYLIDCEQFDKAIKNIDNHCSENSENIFYLYFKKAFCYYKLENYYEAICQFNKCLKFQEHKNICNIYIGLSHLKMNDFENGIFKIEEQLKIDLENKNLEESVNQYQEKVINDIDQDLFCCPLTFEMYKDPYITPNGNTYEHAALIQHLNEVGNFDPLTREYLDENMIIPNRKIRELIEKS